MPTDSDAQTAMREHVARLLGGTVEELRRLSSGASRDTWTLVAADASGARRRLVLQQVDPRDDRIRLPLGMEAALLRAVRSRGVPAPTVVACGEDGLAGRPYLLTEYVAGETIPRRILRDSEFAAARASLVGQLCEALAALHRVPTGSVPGLPGGDQLALLRQTLDRMGGSYPVFEVALRWLERHRPPPGRQVIVHGDFRMGNLIVGRRGCGASWIGAGPSGRPAGGSRLRVRAWRFGAAHPVAGVAAYESLVTRHRLAAGDRVRPEHLRWWEMLGTLKWGILCLVQADAHLSGTRRSHELAVIGRRVTETEYDLLWLLRDELT